MLGSFPRRRADVLLGLCAVVALVLGVGAGAAVDTLAGEAPERVVVTGTATAVGPVTMTLPAALGPWVPASTEAAQEVRASWQGPVELDGVWGVLAPGSVVVTVLTAAAGTHGGVAQVEGSVPDDEPAPWAGRVPHASGAAEADGQREMVLVVETDDGDLVVLSVCGPVEAFDSGSLAEAFRTARVE